MTVTVGWSLSMYTKEHRYVAVVGTTHTQWAGLSTPTAWIAVEIVVCGAALTAGDMVSRAVPLLSYSVAETIPATVPVFAM